MANINKARSLMSFLDWNEKMFPGSKKKILVTANVGKKSYDAINIAAEGESNNLGIFPDDLFSFNGEVTVPYALPAATPPIAPTEQPNWFENTLTTILDASAKVVPAYTNYKLQKDAYKIQLERAKQGQEPIDMSRYGTMPIRVQHEVDLERQRQALTQQFEMDEKTKNALMIGGGIIAAIFVLPKLMNN